MYTVLHTPVLVTHERLPFGTTKQRRVIEISLVVGLVDTLATPSLEGVSHIYEHAEGDQTHRANVGTMYLVSYISSGTE